LRRMGDILDKEIGRPPRPAGRTKTQAIDKVRVKGNGRQVEDAPGAKTMEMGLPALACQGVGRPVPMKRAGVAAEKIIQAAQDKNSQEESGRARIQSFPSH